MSEHEIREDMLYHIALSIAKSMLEKHLVSDEEFAKIDTMLLQRYRPYLGKLLSENDLI